MMWNSLSAYVYPLLSAPIVLMCISGVHALSGRSQEAFKWVMFKLLAGTAFVSLVLAGWFSFMDEHTVQLSHSVWGFKTSAIQISMALLVQFLGVVIGYFSSRYLQGESHQNKYIAYFSMVLACVHLLLLSDHWLLLIVAWAGIAYFMQHLLCFYPERPFAQLAAHKKQIADRLADVMLIIAATLAWSETGSGSISGLATWLHIYGNSPFIDASAVLLVMAVILRTALFPVHGWLIQVMEAPTPVSALLHAGVVNLSGFILIRFSEVLNAVPMARWLLVAFGLGTAVMAGWVMLTRVSIKVRLAWSTVAQMGFMILECGLGLYTFAAMHLIGHSLYKAHAFLSSSSMVQQTKWARMRGALQFSKMSFLIAPTLVLTILVCVQILIPFTLWPWWWSAILALAWSPMLWLPLTSHSQNGFYFARILSGTGLILLLVMLMMLFHMAHLDMVDTPDPWSGYFALLVMSLFYLSLAVLLSIPNKLDSFRRWAFAGFYLDELYTRVTLRIWPIAWGKHSHPGWNSPY